MLGQPGFWRAILRNLTKSDVILLFQVELTLYVKVSTSYLILVSIFSVMGNGLLLLVLLCNRYVHRDTSKIPSNFTKLFQDEQIHKNQISIFL